MVDIAHAVPCEMRRTCEISADIIVRKTMLTPYLLPHRLLSCISQRHIDTVHGHPIDKTFPILPFPPRHRVSEGAVVKEKSVLYLSLNAHRTIYNRHFCGIFHRLECIPWNGYTTVILQVMVESCSHGNGIISFDHKLPTL